MPMVLTLSAEEVMRWFDNNCDESIDEGVTTTYYAIDTDGDTYGDPDVDNGSLQLRHLYVEDMTDCDDDDIEINPGADNEIHQKTPLIMIDG